MKDKIVELDYLRGFAILGVIMIHTTGWFTTVGSLTYVTGAMLFVDTLSGYAVPLFLFISGFVLFHNYSSKFKLLEFYKKRVLSIIPPYIIFSILYMAYEYTIGGVTNFSLKSIVSNLIFAKSSYHFWYIIIIIQFYVLYPVIAKLYVYCKQKNKVDSLLALSLIIQVCWNYFFQHGFPLLDQNNLFVSIVSKMGFVFLSHIFYFMIGIYIADNIPLIQNFLSKIRTKLLIVICIFLAISVSSIYIDIYYHHATGLRSSIYYLINPILFCFAFVLFYKISSVLMIKKNIISLVICNLGRYSFGIYLVHLIFVNLIIILLKDMNIQADNILYYILLFPFATIFSFIATKLISYLPYSKYIIGIHSLIKQKKKSIDPSD